MTDLETLRLLTGSKDEKLLQVLLHSAEEQTLAYTHRTTIPDPLRKSVRDLAVIAYNRMGTEGESSRSGSGESYHFEDLPKSIQRVLDGYRLARVGGVRFEAKT